MDFFAFMFCILIGGTAIMSLVVMLVSSFSTDRDSGEATKTGVWVFFSSLLAAAIFLSGVFSGWYKP